MSRHRLIRALDADEELDVFDGEDEDDYDDVEHHVSDKDKEALRLGAIDVRDALGPSGGFITDEQIQEALWYYYFDVQKSVAYLIKTHIEKPVIQKKEKVQPLKKEQGALLSFASAGAGASKFYGGCTDAGPGQCLGGSARQVACSKPFSFADFFKDTPWLNVPTDRQAIFVAPLYPRGGLLGGSSNGAPKMSKLQALAAARKKKAQEQKSNGSTGVEQPMESLTLNQTAQKAGSSSEPATKPTRGFPLRKRKDSNPHEKTPKAPPSEPQLDQKVDTAVDDVPLDRAEPSAFASAMFGGPPRISSRQHQDHLFTLPYTTALPFTAADPFAGPSPDDVVIAAQSKASKKSSKRVKIDQISNGVDAINLDKPPSPKLKSKHLNVLEEFEKTTPKKSANFVVIGHVDHGKSTLTGRLLLDLKVVDQRTIERYRKEAALIGKSSFALAWVLDQGAEERARGVTIDIATNKFETEKTAFTIVDAPGHKDFIPNMLAGAAQADFAVLVVDASTGNFEAGLKGQTKEHALLVRSMGVQRIIVAVNKMDMVKWSQERFSEIETQISAFLTAAGFQSKNIAFLPCSGLNGDNIARRSEDPDASWYTGPTLVEELDNSEPITRALAKPLRLTIGDIFRGGVQNPLSISGRIEAGSLQTGDQLLAQPSSQKCFIKGLEVDDETVDWAVAGQNVTIHLTGIEQEYLKIGDVMCSPTSPIQNIKQFTAKVLAFEFLTPMEVDVHRGRLHTPGLIKEIVAVLDKGTGAVTTAGAKGKKKVKLVKPGQITRIVVELDVAVPLEAPARVVLRSNGETVAAGILE